MFVEEATKESGQGPLQLSQKQKKLAISSKEAFVNTTLVLTGVNSGLSPLTAFGLLRAEKFKKNFRF